MYFFKLLEIKFCLLFVTSSWQLMHLFRSQAEPSPSLLRRRSSPPVPFFNPRWQVSKKIQIDPVSGGPPNPSERPHSAPRAANVGPGSEEDILARVTA